jgi:hypothetical protein
MNTDKERAITLRRDGKGVLKFKGERIGAARKVSELYDNNDDSYMLETSARLFKTSGGKYVVGVEEYDKTNEQYGIRFAEVATTLQKMVELLKGLKGPKGPRIDYDILGELFEDTEFADQFVGQID